MWAYVTESAVWWIAVCALLDTDNSHAEELCHVSTRIGGMHSAVPADFFRTCISDLSPSLLGLSRGGWGEGSSCQGKTLHRMLTGVEGHGLRPLEGTTFAVPQPGCYPVGGVTCMQGPDPRAQMVIHHGPVEGP